MLYHLLSTSSGVYYLWMVFCYYRVYATPVNFGELARKLFIIGIIVNDSLNIASSSGNVGPTRISFKIDKHDYINTQ